MHALIAVGEEFNTQLTIVCISECMLRCVLTAGDGCVCVMGVEAPVPLFMGVWVAGGIMGTGEGTPPPPITASSEVTVA